MADTNFLDDLVKEDPTKQQKQETPEEKAAKATAEAEKQALSIKEKGFYNEMKAERIKRQEIQSQLDQLKGTITTILEQKRQSAKEGADVAKKFAGIPISETEDGDLFLPEEHLQKMV